MTDAKPSILRPDLGGGYTRPPELAKGNYALQSRAALLAQWVQVSSPTNLSPLPPFGTAVGSPLHMDYDTASYTILGLQCLGDPSSMDDHSVAQATKDTIPVVGRVLAPYMWFDWIRVGARSIGSANKLLLAKTGVTYNGSVTRAGLTRASLQYGGVANNNGSTSFSWITPWIIAAPGNATATAYDCPLLSEDGTTPAPLQLRMPCYVYRYGFLGAVGQSISSPSSDGYRTMQHGPYLRLLPWRSTFAGDVPNRKIAFTVTTSDFGCEARGALGYDMEFFEAPVSFRGRCWVYPPGAYQCYDFGLRCVSTKTYSTYVSVRTLLIGNSYKLIVSVSQLKFEQTFSGVTYYDYGSHGSTQYAELSDPVATAPDVITATADVGFNTTTTLHQNLFGGEAEVNVTIVVNATGKITTCEAVVVPLVPIVTSGSGWRDLFKGM